MIFINIFCIFDTVDNINAKVAIDKGVKVMDLALARIGLNFVSACLFVYFCNQHIYKAIPGRYYCTLTYRSLMLLVGQVLNVFSISILPLSLLTILQNTQAFWTALMGYLINRETFLRIEIIGILACFVGVILIAS